jgi:hypothetical protein
MTEVGGPRLEAGWFSEACLRVEQACVRVRAVLLPSSIVWQSWCHTNRDPLCGHTFYYLDMDFTRWTRPKLSIKVRRSCKTLIGLAHFGPTYLRWGIVWERVQFWCENRLFLTRFLSHLQMHLLVE